MLYCGVRAKPANGYSVYGPAMGGFRSDTIDCSAALGADPRTFVVLLEFLAGVFFLRTDGQRSALTVLKK